MEITIKIPNKYMRDPKIVAEAIQQMSNSLMYIDLLIDIKDVMERSMVVKS